MSQVHQRSDDLHSNTSVTRVACVGEDSVAFTLSLGRTPAVLCSHKRKKGKRVCRCVQAKLVVQVTSSDIYVIYDNNR
jgi:hypothetical protein